MAHVHGAAGAAQTSKLAAPVAKTAVVAAAAAHTPAGRSLLGKLLGHPLVLFGLGVATGYAIHKYRKEIIESATRAAEKGQDFILQQRENLEDLVAEAPESEA